MLINKEIKAHLIENHEFLSALKKEFNSEQKEAILNLLRFDREDYPTVCDDFYDWLSNCFNSGTEVLSIGWESRGWGPGGSGCVDFYLCFGIVSFWSSDYEDDHIEIFDKKTFEPWCIESLYNDYIDISSKIYNEKELIEIAEQMGMNEDTVLVVNNKEIKN